MLPSFKQFNSFLEQANDAAPQQLDELFGKFFGKEPAEKEKDLKNKVLTAKELLDQKKQKDKEKAEERKKELEKKKNEAWLAAKERAEGGRRPRDGRDEYALHRNI